VTFKELEVIGIRAMKRAMYDFLPDLHCIISKILSLIDI